MTSANVIGRGALCAPPAALTAARAMVVTRNLWLIGQSQMYVEVSRRMPTRLSCSRDPVHTMPDSQKTSPSGLPIAPVYGPEDAPVDYARDLGDPGQFPFTRGVQASMYRGRLWTMRQYAGFGTAAETNRRSRPLLDAGQTGLSVAFDVPTQIGIDFDSPRAAGEG